MTRYLNLRKYAEQDPEIEFMWAPVAHYTPPDMPSRLRFLPEPLFMRARVIQQALPVLNKLASLDAVMIHLFEADILCSLRSYLHRTPVHVSSTDEAPITNRAAYPLYPSDLTKPVWRQKLRLAIDMWRIRHTDLFIPFSRWAAGILVECGAPRDHVYPMHVGLDLDLWNCPPRPPTPAGAKPKILFVGTDFVRKGGSLLLDVFERRFQGRAELHLVTMQAPKDAREGVYVHADFKPNDPRLTRLYQESDVLVVPTTADTGPLWVFMEAMAMRLPVIGTDTGANKELVQHGKTGLIVKIGDGGELGAAIETLLDDAELRRAMGERGRELVEARYSARVNVPLILRRMKDAVDESRGLESTARQRGTHAGA
jgi:glycosyltransferase involved in cell wall biosynthesis